MKKVIISAALTCIFWVGSAQTGINNLSFENWSVSGGPTPAGFLSRGAAQMTVGALDLTSYVRLTSNGQPTTNPFAAGAMQLGSVVNQAPFSGAAYTLKPLALTGYYKCNLAGQDTAYIGIDLKKNGISILAGNAGFRIITSTNTWTSFTIALTYTENVNPDSIQINVAANKSFAGNSPGSFGTTLDIDGFSLVANTTGVTQFEKHATLISAYPNPASENFRITSETEGASMVEIYNSKGTFVARKNFENQKVAVCLQDYAPGIYFYKVFDHESRILRIDKFVVEH